MKVHLLSNGLSGLAILAFLISGCGSSSSSGTSSAAKQEWVWVGGTNYSNQPGVYGTQGQPSPQNTPGARMGAASWTDTQGNFWLLDGGVFEVLDKFIVPKEPGSSGIFVPASHVH